MNTRKIKDLDRRIARLDLELSKLRAERRQLKDRDRQEEAAVREEAASWQWHLMKNRNGRYTEESDRLAQGRVDLLYEWLDGKTIEDVLSGGAAWKAGCPNDPYTVERWLNRVILRLRQSPEGHRLRSLPSDAPESQRAKVFREALDALSKAKRPKYSHGNAYVPNTLSVNVAGTDVSR